jgi:predicted TIM-barrel fold metal-dependent hydrolase
MPGPVIDADSHVYETEATWEYLPERYKARRPVPITLEPGAAPYLGRMNAFWLVDGRVVNWTWGKGTVQVGTPLTSVHAIEKPISVGSQALTDVDARLRDLDQAGIDIQVIYPSLFLVPLSEDDEFEAALTQAYNSFMAAQCGKRPDRLKWAAMLPLRDVPTAVKEVERAKQLGAVSLVTFGTVGDKMLHAREFDPVWQAAQESGLPVCVHVGWSFPPLTQACDEHMSSLTVSFTMPLLMGFFSMTAGGVLERFPRLRVAFLEAGAGWLPWWIERIDHYHPVATWFRNSFGLGPLPQQKPGTYLDRVYMTCEADERLLPQALEVLGEDKMMVSEDMPHLEDREGSVGELQRRTDISEEAKRKIVTDNPIRFYGLEAAVPAAV